MNINPLELMKNAQKLQEQMNDAKARMGDMRCAGSSGGGMVEVEINGMFELLSIKIAPEIAGSGDAEMMQDLILAASASAHEKMREAMSSEIGAMAQEAGLSGLSALKDMF
ncbi:MAG: YbaB/EbfC family nucleoid-associated protein [Treponema sp.]|nr:YbaB/EbfC family nucleoid-associated protein [Treponema sp.]